VIVWEQVATRRLANGGALDVRAVRAFVGQTLRPVTDRIDLADVDLMTAEIATNALRYSASGHPGGGLWVTVLRSADRVRLEFQDDGGAKTVPTVRADHGESGRGLLLVAGLSAAWGYEIGENGQRRITVWFEVTTPRVTRA
jgi:two-component sensor histidine kinase